MTRKPDPNPQGKGLVPLLQGLQQHWAGAEVPPKHIDQISLELFTSLFVLQSEIRLNPVPGQDYWLYRQGKRWKLSLVGPDEWGGAPPGRYVGHCVLQPDRTWTLDLDAALAQDPVFMAEIEARRARLQESLEQAESLENALPGYEENLGYHARVLAFVLGRSLRRSMQLTGIAALDYRQARGLLPGAGGGGKS